MVVGRLLSYWEGNFSGAMLNFGGQPTTLPYRFINCALQGRYRNEKVDGFSTCENRYLFEWEPGDFESEITLDEWIFLHGFMGKSNSCSWKTWVHLKKTQAVGVFLAYLRNGNLPQGVQIKDIWNHHLEKESPFWEAENCKYLKVNSTLFNFMSFFQQNHALNQLVTPTNIETFFHWGRIFLPEALSLETHQSLNSQVGVITSMVTWKQDDDCNKIGASVRCWSSWKKQSTPMIDFKSLSCALKDLCFSITDTHGGHFSILP